jgi:hypothetical protein
MNRNRNLGRLASLAVAILAVLAVTACGGSSSAGEVEGTFCRRSRTVAR